MRMLKLFGVAVLSLLFVILLTATMSLTLINMDNQVLSNAINYVTGNGYVVYGVGTDYDDDFLPGANNTYNLGSLLKQWKNLVTDNLTVAGNATIVGDATVSDLTALSLTDSGLTSGRIPIAGVGGLLGDDADLTFSGTSLQVSGANVTRTATYVVAASNAPAYVKAQADYVCDGTADDVQIQAAIDAASVSGGKVHLSSGLFTISAPLVPKTQMFLEGEGTGATLGTRIKIADNSNINALGYAVAATLYLLKVSDLEFDGNNATQTVPTNLVDLDYIATALFYNVAFVDTSQDALVYGDNSNKLYLDHCIFYDSVRYQVYLHGGDQSFFSNNVFMNTGLVGLVIDGTENVFVTDNMFFLSTDAHLQVSGGSFHITIANNYFDDSKDHGINILSGGNIVITGNQMMACGYTTFKEAIGISGPSKNILIANNVISGAVPPRASAYGVYVGDGATDVRIHDNDFTLFGANNFTVALIRSSATTTTYIYNNQGYITENSGTAVILNGNNAVNVNQGLSTNATGIWLTSSNNETGLLYLSGENVTSFTINSANNVTANRNVYWRAVIGAGN